MTPPTPSTVCPVCDTPDGDHLDWCTPQAREQRPSKELFSGEPTAPWDRKDLAGPPLNEAAWSYELRSYYERWQCAARAEIERLQRQQTNLIAALGAKQAKLDEIMLEMYPGELSPQRRAELRKPAHEREPPHCSTCGCGLAPEPGQVLCPSCGRVRFCDPKECGLWHGAAQSPVPAQCSPQADGFSAIADAVSKADPANYRPAPPAVDVRSVDCPACGKPMSEHKGDLKPGAVLWCP